MDQGLQAPEYRSHIVHRKHLSLVKQQHTVGHVVELPAPGRPVGKKRFEELDIGGNDHRRVPVFRGQPPGVHLFIRILIFHLAVVFNDIFLSQVGPENVRRLFDDGSIGNHINDVFFPAGPGFFQRPGKGGNGFASAGGNGQGIDPVSLILPHLDAALEDLTPLPVQIILWMEEPLFLQGGKEPVMELFQRSETAPFHCASLHIGFCVQKIPVHQAGIQHPQPKATPYKIHLPLDLEILDDLFDSLDLNRHF